MKSLIAVLALVLVIQSSAIQAQASSSGRILVRVCQRYGGQVASARGTCSKLYIQKGKCCIPRDGAACGPGKEIDEQSEMCGPCAAIHFKTEDKGICLPCTDCTLMGRTTQIMCTATNNTVCGPCYDGYKPARNVDGSKYECERYYPPQVNTVPVVDPTAPFATTDGKNGRATNKNKHPNPSMEDGMHIIIIVLVLALVGVCSSVGIAVSVYKRKKIRAFCQRQKEKNPDEIVFHEASSSSGSGSLHGANMEEERQPSERSGGAHGSHWDPSEDYETAVSGAATSVKHVERRDESITTTDVKQVKRRGQSEHEYLLPTPTQATAENDATPSACLLDSSAHCLEENV